MLSLREQVRAMAAEPDANPPSSDSSWLGVSFRAWDKAAVFGVVGIFLLHFMVIWYYAVDLPNGDEWHQVLGYWNPHFSLDWVLAPHGEHTMIPTKLQMWVLSQVSHGNVIFIQMSSYVIWGAALLAFIKVATKIAPQMPISVLMAFVLFLNSNLPFEMHSFGAFNSPYHFTLLFLFLMVDALFLGTQSWGRLLLGGVWGVLSMWSLGAGFGFAISTLVFFMAYKLSRARQEPETRTTEILQFATVTTVILSGGVLWLNNYEKWGSYYAPAMPNTIGFWKFLANEISYGFGFETFSVALGIFCASVALIPLGIFLIKGRKFLGETWALVATFAAVLASLLAIALGRGGELWMAKSSRYGQLAIFLVPLAAVAGYRAFEGERRKGYLIFLWVLAGLGFANNWRTVPYRSVYITRTAGAECVEKYYAKGGPVHCPTIFEGTTIKPQLDYARLHEISFAKRLGHGRN